jgi:hypothetical protein
MPRRSPATKSPRKKRAPIKVDRLGFTCFRLVLTYDPEPAYEVRRVAEPRSRMAVFAGPRKAQQTRRAA